MNSATILPEGYCEFELSPEAEAMLIPFLNVEIELLQGSREQLPDGRVRLVFTVTDHQKKELIRHTLLKLITNQGYDNPN